MLKKQIYPTGFSLIEFVIVTSILIIMIFTINPTIILKTLNTKIMSMAMQQDSQRIFMHIEKILENGANILVNTPHSVTIQNQSDTYQLSITGIGTTESPYHLISKKNDDTPITISHQIANVDTNQPGFQCHYYDQNKNETSTSTNIKQIRVQLTLKYKNQTLQHVTSFPVKQSTISIYAKE